MGWLSTIGSAFKALGIALGLIQQNKDQTAGAIAQRESDAAGVLKDVQTSNSARDGLTLGGPSAVDRVLIDDARADSK